MRKTITLIITFILILTLTACGNVRSVKGYFVDMEIYSNSIEFSIEIEDPNEEVTGNIVVEIYKEKDNEYVDNIVLSTVFDYEDILFRGLTAGEKYKLVIKAMIGRNSVTIEEMTITTKEASIIHIKTVADFINMDDNPGGTFVLDNDLDFSSKNNMKSLYASASKGFTGSFDGQGYTIRNLNYSSLGLYGGVFGYVNTGEIKNLNIENINIGKETDYVSTTVQTKVGFLAGLVYSSKAVIKDINIKNASMYATFSSSSQIHVGSLVGDLRSSVKDINIENSKLHVKTTSAAKLKLGGVAGYVDDNAAIRRTKADVDITYSLEASFKNASKRDFSLNIGGVVGDYNSRLSKGLSEIIYNGNILVDLDFGSYEEQEGTYRLNLGGIAGVAYGQLDNILAKSNITVNHEANENEEAVNKRFYVGGIAGYLETNHTVNSVLNLNENRKINLNISDDVTLYVSYTAGRNAIITNQEMGYTNTDLLFRNQENIAENTLSQQIFTIKDFFNSNFINEHLQ